MVSKESYSEMQIYAIRHRGDAYPAFYAFIIKISPAFYKILLNMLDYQIFIVSLHKINNRGHNYEIFK